MHVYECVGGFSSFQEACYLASIKNGERYYDQQNIKKEVIHNTTIININVPESASHKLKDLDITLFSNKPNDAVKAIISLFED